MAFALAHWLVRPGAAPVMVGQPRARPVRALGLGVGIPILVAVGAGALPPLLLRLGSNEALLIGNCSLAVALGVVYLRQQPFSVLSPVVLFVSALGANVAMGPVANQLVATGTGGVHPIWLTPTEVVATADMFVTAINACLIGATARLLIGRGRSASRTGPAVDIIGSVSHQLEVAALLLAWLCVGTQIVARGTGLLWRANYIEGQSGDPQVVVSLVLAMPVVAILAYLAAGSSSWFIRLAALAGVAVEMLILFSLATRQFALAPVVAALAAIAARPTSRRFKIAFVLAVMGSLVLLQLPLHLRSNPDHGLIPYLAALVNLGEGFGLSAWIGNAFYAFPLAGWVALHTPALTPDALAVSLSPLPGGAVGWYDLLDSLRLDIYTPFNGIGELGNYGFGVLVVFFIITGGALQHFDARIRRLFTMGQPVLALVILMLLCFFTLDLLQYNLRSAIRFLYYAIAVDVGSLIFFSAVSPARANRSSRLRPALNVDRPAPTTGFGTR